jgi:hypothetical protein
MGNRMAGRGRAAVVPLRGQVGQGTVEYVALILLVAAIFAGVVALSTKTRDGQNIGKTISGQITDAIKKVTDEDRK